MNQKPFFLTSFVALSLFAIAGCGSDDADADSNGAGTCRVVDLGDGTSAIRCPDGSELVVKNGTNGQVGKDGKDAVDGKDGKDGKDGADGKDADSTCSLAHNEDGTHTLTCGDKSVVIGAPCEGGFPDDLWVTSPDSSFHDPSLTLFQVTTCTWIRGSVYVTEYSEKELPNALLRIENIDGSLQIGYDYGNDELESVSFPALKTVGDKLRFSWNDAMKEIADFPKLESIGGRLKVDNNQELRKIGNFPLLTSVQGLEFRDSDKLESIGSFDQLVNTGSLEWYFLDNLTTMGSFPRLERAATFNFGENHSMESLADFPALYAIEGSSSYMYAVEIWGNQKLAAIDGLKNVTTVDGKIYIADNPELPQADVDDLIDALDELTGSVITCGNKDGDSCD